MIVFNLVGFSGLPLLLIAFFAAQLNVPYAYQIFVCLFCIFWLTLAACWLWHMSAKLDGK